MGVFSDALTVYYFLISGSFFFFFFNNLGFAVGGDLLERRFLELLHHLPPLRPLLLLQTGGV